MVYHIPAVSLGKKARASEIPGSTPWGFRVDGGKIVDLTTLGREREREREKSISEIVTHYHFGVADFQCDPIEFRTSRVIRPKALEI